MDWTTETPAGWDKGLRINSYSELPNREFEARRLPNGKVVTQRVQFGWLYDYKEGDHTDPYHGKLPRNIIKNSKRKERRRNMEFMNDFEILKNVSDMREYLAKTQYGTGQPGTDETRFDDTLAIIEGALRKRIEILEFNGRDVYFSKKQAYVDNRATAQKEKA